MADGRPRLVAVGEPPDGASPFGARAAGHRAAPPGRRLVIPLLAIALAICALGWGLAHREAATLARELAAEQQALAAAGLRLERLEAQRARVRTHVEALAAEAAAFAGRLGELEALVVADLEAAADVQPTGNEGERAD